MKQSKFLRNTLSIALCLAGVLLFAACDKENQLEESKTQLPAEQTPADDGGDALWCDNDFLEGKLRNVRFTYSQQHPLSRSCDTIVQSEAMSCAGRLYGRSFSNFCNEYPTNHKIAVYELPHAVTYYSLDDNEYFRLEDIEECQASICDNSFLGSEATSALEQYRQDRIDYSLTCWDSPYIVEGTGYKVTTWRSDEEPKTIAGIQCSGYAIHKKTEQGTLITENVLHKVWYDPQTNIPMRYEEYDSDNDMTYWFEITAIEYGTVTKNHIDTILNEWLETHDPTDISNYEYPGTDW
jgi:hypothetical protein